MERFKMIYLDNSATTKPYPEALATYTEVASKIWEILLVSTVWAIRRPAC